MKYVFGFNVGVKLYKKFPTIQIFTQDRLIDEFRLNDSHIFQEFSLYDNDKRLANQPFKSLLNSVSKKINLYILNDECLQDDIKLVIKNQDSNYTNGFMTKSTLVRFSHIFLMPEEIFLDENAQSQINSPFENIGWPDTDPSKEQDKRFITRWPLCENFNGTEYGGDVILTIPISHDMKYKHFDMDSIVDEYYPANDLGFDGGNHKNVFVNVSRFMSICKKISNKYKHENQ
jgi:hypothetical protein